MLAAIDSSIPDTLRRRPPLLHGDGGHYFGLAWKALEWIESSVGEGMRTLETGTGASTIVFAARGARHTAISPAPDEHWRIREYCAQQGISTEHVEFVDEPSHTALERLDLEPLDVVLIDGAHGFPFPIFDWYFAQEKLKVGGAILVDDAYIPAVNTLVAGLRDMRAWRLESAPGGRTAVFRKVEDIEPSFDALAENWAPVFNYLPLPQRIAAGLRVRTLDRGLLARLVRRRIARRTQG
jgi:hypothetical protein